VTEKRQPPEQPGLSDEELAGHQVTRLPDREAMSVIGDIAIPLDPERAADALLGQDAPDEPEDPPAG